MDELDPVDLQWPAGDNARGANPLADPPSAGAIFLPQTARPPIRDLVEGKDRNVLPKIPLSVTTGRPWNPDANPAVSESTSMSILRA
jgi:hypothetical protein